MSNIELKSFEGQVAVVTGAGAGMGREHALLYGKRGASVVVNDVSSDAANAVVKEITDVSGKAVVSTDDVSNPDSATEIINKAIKNFGRIDILVSNAGIINNTKFEEMTPENFDKVMKVNAYGAFYVINAAWKEFVKQKYGRIVIITSSSAYISQPLIGHYAASKAAVLGLGKTLAAEAVEHNITVNMVAPGAFTAMSGMMEDEEARKRQEERMAASLVSPAVLWLSHKDTKFNGKIFEVAAGRVAENFIGSNKGYWSKELTVEKLFENEQDILNQEGYKTLENTVELSKWMTEDNTGW